MKDKQIPGFDGVHKQHNKEKASKPKAGGKAWPFSKEAKKHAKAGRDLVRAISMIQEYKFLKTTYFTQFYDPDTSKWTDFNEFSDSRTCIKSVLTWRKLSPKFDYRAICRQTQAIDGILEPGLDPAH